MPPSALKKRRLTTATQSRPQKRTITDNVAMAASSSTSVEEDDSSMPILTQSSLARMTPQQRQTHYKQLFFKKVEPLAHIRAPDECIQFPEFKGEIIDAYLKWTTFSIQIWTNYDAAAKKFYVDNRVQDCGRLNFTRRDQAYLNRIDPDQGLQLGRIRLEIGTAFTSLCVLKLTATPSLEEVGVDVRAKRVEANANHPRAVDFATNICNSLDQADLGYDQHGFLLSDLEEIAAMFYRKLTQAEVGKLRYSPDVGPFMSEESENPAWVDFEKMEKECWPSCQGCSGSKYYRYKLGGYTSRFW